MRRPAVVLETLLDDLRGIEDDREAGELVSEALKRVKEFNAEAARLRQEIGLRLRAQGLTYPEIAAIFDVNPSRVPQILKGEPTGRWAKAARESSKEEPGETGTAASADHTG
jgi:DNA-directed RNA polymerase specialized sigma24 family protein